MMRFLSMGSIPQKVVVHTDGAIQPEAGISGLAAVVSAEDGQIRAIWSRRAGKLTCNEAEYAAAHLALENLLRRGAREVLVRSDSQVMVHQMSGLASAQSPKLKQAQSRLRALVVQFEQVKFEHIPREQNQVADAVASEALGGKEQNYG